MEKIKLYKGILHTADFTEEMAKAEDQNYSEEEIKIIIKFQYVQDAAMDEVLSGRYYWSATGQVENTKSSSASGSNSAVRCIRNAF